jgi:hypothetical protein
MIGTVPWAENASLAILTDGEGEKQCASNWERLTA